MLTRVYSAALYGVDAIEVEIEVDEGRGNWAVVIVGLPDAAVRESCDRVTTALKNCRYPKPQGRTTTNLAYWLAILLGRGKPGREAEYTNNGRWRQRAFIA